MAFGQQSGPPASTKEVAQLEALLGEAGYSSFREARHIYGLTQRQAAGKFTRGEAAELLARLRDGDGDPDEASERAARRLAHRQAEQAAALPDELLADELVRRGWMCVPPS